MNEILGLLTKYKARSQCCYRVEPVSWLEFGGSSTFTDYFDLQRIFVCIVIVNIVHISNISAFYYVILFTVLLAELVLRFSGLDLGLYLRRRSVV